MSATEDLAKTESAASLAARIRRKDVSPVEVVDSAIARIETYNSKINALIIFGYDDARKAARQPRQRSCAAMISGHCTACRSR